MENNTFATSATKTPSIRRTKNGMKTNESSLNACTKHDDSAIKMIERKYAASGYTLPNIIFWNLNAAAGQSPVTFDKKGTALISGFSPSIMTSVLKATDINPKSIMLETINVPRYEVIV